MFKLMLAGTFVAHAVLASGAWGQETAVLPAGVRAVWDMAKAHRETTPTRQRVCINGLWRWQPADGEETRVPQESWGFFKVPGPWPQSADDVQRLYVHPAWQNVNLRLVTAACCQREITIPADWTGRRISVCAEYVNSFAAVYMDGARVGEILYPDGELDITSVCKPGRAHLLSMRVLALPLKSVIETYSQTNEAQLQRGSVERRGLTGDVYLLSTPATARIEEVKVDPSTRKWQITLDAALALEPAKSYSLRARMLDGEKEAAALVSRSLGSSDLNGGRYRFTAEWKPDRLWDIHTPGNIYELELSLLDERGDVIDTFQSVRFGFREFYIQGRDFFLNGSRIFCPNTPFEDANRGPYEATYEAAREHFAFYRKLGIVAVFTHYYDTQPGAHSALGEVLRAADDVGMLISLSQPHARQYDWDKPEEVTSYRRHAAFFIRQAQNHPCVVFYSTTHNATAYNEDMNPDQIGDAAGRRETGFTIRNTEAGVKAEAILRKLDDSRVVYHHSSPCPTVSIFRPRIWPTTGGRPRPRNLSARGDGAVFHRRSAGGLF